MIPHWIADIAVGLACLSAGGTAGLVVGMRMGRRAGMAEAATILTRAAQRVTSLEGRVAVKEAIEEVRSAADSV